MNQEEAAALSRRLREANPGADVYLHDRGDGTWAVRIERQFNSIHDFAVWSHRRETAA